MIPLIGAVMIVVSAFAFWWLLPKQGKVHWLAAIPSIEAYVPVFITSGFALGIVMMLSLLTR